MNAMLAQYGGRSAMLMERPIDDVAGASAATLRYRIPAGLSCAFVAMCGTA
jgi:hypothetical protein